MHLTSANVVNGADRPVFPHTVVTAFQEAAPGLWVRNPVPRGSCEHFDFSAWTIFLC